MAAKYKFCKVLLQVNKNVETSAENTIEMIKKAALRSLQQQVPAGTLVREVDNYTVADRVYNIAQIEGQRVLQLQSQRK